ncbi:hypothetical protein JVT61DRAFT_1640 [Boletus reticuloceps]|uniref:Uncharacterized protein n=1 Tax=Boletus reticuloceps TaxID=495285 RepID=A0A8I3A9C4_9AGAM|nr:hypothetical protein JVT61DRAFT_1640 [Boletus reticuloceps]
MVSLESMKNGLYMNHVQWEDNVASDTSILYNENHCFHYIWDHSEVQYIYLQLQKANEEPSQNQASGNKILGL